MMTSQAVKLIKNGSPSSEQKKDAQTRNQLALFRYMQDVNTYKLLSSDETEALVIKYQKKGDQQAGNELVTANLRLVVKIAGDFQKYWTTNFLDLVQEGNGVTVHGQLF